MFENDHRTNQEYGEGEFVYPVKEKTNPSFSQPVPRLTSSLEREGDIDFLMSAMGCHCQEMTVKNMSQIVSTGERERVIHSPPFIVQDAYKLCLHVALSQNDVAIAIKIMKGERDKQLAWPFNYIVIFRLKNQGGGQDKAKMFRCEKNGFRLKNS